MAREFVTRKRIETLSSHDKKTATPSMRSRTRNLSLQLKLWTITGKKNLLVGIVLPDGFVCNTAQDIFDALISHWKLTFAHKKIDVLGATLFAQKHCRIIDFSDSHPPSAYSFTRFFQNARHSGTGRNGIPYCACEHTDDRSSPIFENVFYWIADGNAMEDDFNDTLKIFIPNRRKRRH